MIIMQIIIYYLTIKNIKILLFINPSTYAANRYSQRNSQPSDWRNWLNSTLTHHACVRRATVKSAGLSVKRSARTFAFS